jgi:hypothetical protein
MSDTILWVWYCPYIRKLQMKPHPECGLCMMKWVYERVGNTLSEEKQFAILKELAAVFAAEAEPSMNMGILCNRSVAAVHKSLLDSCGFYGPLKRKSNEAAEALIGKAKAFIENSASPGERFVKACGLAAVSNVAPIGVPSAPFEFSLVEDIIEGKAPSPCPQETFTTPFQRLETSSMWRTTPGKSGSIPWSFLFSRRWARK